MNQRLMRVSTMLVAVVLGFHVQDARNQTYAQSQAQPQQVQAGQASSALPSGAVRVRPVLIIDRNGFGRPMTAATMLVPVGWQPQGGISWQQNTAGCGPLSPHLNWGATSPDGSSVIQMLPEEKWSGHNMQYGSGAQ